MLKRTLVVGGAAALSLGLSGCTAFLPVSVEPRDVYVSFSEESVSLISCEPFEVSTARISWRATGDDDYVVVFEDRVDWAANADRPLKISVDDLVPKVDEIPPIESGTDVAVFLDGVDENDRPKTRGSVINFTQAILQAVRSGQWVRGDGTVTSDPCG